MKEDIKNVNNATQMSELVDNISRGNDKLVKYQAKCKRYNANVDKRVSKHEPVGHDGYLKYNTLNKQLAYQEHKNTPDTFKSKKAPQPANLTKDEAFLIELARPCKKIVCANEYKVYAQMAKEDNKLTKEIRSLPLKEAIKKREEYKLTRVAILKELQKKYPNPINERHKREGFYLGKIILGNQSHRTREKYVGIGHSIEYVQKLIDECKIHYGKLVTAKQFFSSGIIYRRSSHMKYQIVHEDWDTNPTAKIVQINTEASAQAA